VSDVVAISMSKFARFVWLRTFYPIMIQ